MKRIISCIRRMLFITNELLSILSFVFFFNGGLAAVGSRGSTAEGLRPSRGHRWRALLGLGRACGLAKATVFTKGSFTNERYEKKYSHKINLTRDLQKNDWKKLHFFVWKDTKQVNCNTIFSLVRHICRTCIQAYGIRHQSLQELLLQKLNTNSKHGVEGISLQNLLKL